MRWGKWVLGLAVAGVVCVVAQAREPDAPPPAAPPPSEGAHFKNLKVLPSDISKKELITTMHAYNDALGVKCGYCHVMEPKKDFAADTEHKNTARWMIKMTAGVTKTFHDASAKAPEVTCFMCHRGAEKPEMAPKAPASAPAH